MEESPFTFATTPSQPTNLKNPHPLNEPGSLYTSTGPLLFGVFYRPPNDPLENLDSLETELAHHSTSHIGTFLCGDLNVHEARWLRFSNVPTTPAGRRLREISESFNLTETVRAPTRNEYLLDLLLTDHPNATKTTVLPRIADHSPVLAKLSFDPIHEIPHTRAVWDYKHANWDALNHAFSHTDWNTLLNKNVDDATDTLKNYITATAKQFIPTRTLHDKTTSHPWLDDDCRNAIHAKQLAEGTTNYAKAYTHCQTTLAHAHQQYKLKLREKLRTLPEGSKQ